MLLVDFRKLRGDPPEEPVTAKPCVGLCYLMRLRGIEMETTTRKPKRPCVGLCYLAKIGKVSKSEDDEEADEGGDEEEEVEDEEEYEEEDEEYEEDSGDFSGDYEEEEDF